MKISSTFVPTGYSCRIFSISSLLGNIIIYRPSARMIHVSTISVSGNSMADIFDGYVSEEELIFSESNLYIGQPLDNVYIRSKFSAEAAILERMADGFPANIIRVGNLTNRTWDLKFQPNYESNGFLSRVRAMCDMKMLPEYIMPLYCEFTPIDDAAGAILSIAQHFNDTHTIFHVNSPKVVYFDRLIAYLNDVGMKVEVLGSDAFAERLSELGKHPETEYIYQALINDMDEHGNLVYDSNIRIENDITTSYLRSIGFEWSEIDFNYLKMYVEYFRDLDYFK